LRAEALQRREGAHGLRYAVHAGEGVDELVCVILLAHSYVPHAMSKDSTVTIHGGEWKRADIEDEITYFRGIQWRREPWVRRDALVQRSGGTSLYVGQRYDPADFELVRGGWDHDHCEICWWSLTEGGDEEDSTGYTDGQRWICSECYHQFIETTA